MPRWPALALLVLFAAHTHAFPKLPVPAGPPATIDLLLPAGATAGIDGKPLGDRRAVTLDDIRPAEIRRVKLAVKFADGAEDERAIDVAAGQRFPVAVSQPGPDRPATVATQTLTPITAAALSPDGRHIAVGLESKVVVLWDTVAGRPVRTLAGHQKAVPAVAFSPDGKRVLSGSADGTAILWDADTGAQLLSLRKHTGPVLSVAYSPDGSRLLTGSFDSTAVLWDARTGSPLLTLKGHAREVFAVAFSPDGALLATASGDRTAALWDAATGRQTVSLKGHKEEVSCVAFSPDGRRVGTASWENLGYLWDPATGKRVGGTAGKHSGDVYSIAFTPDGRRYITGDRDEGVMMWETATGERARTFAGHSADVVSISVAGDGRTFLTGSRDGTAKLWDLTTGRELLSLTTDATRKHWAVVAPDGLYDASESGRRVLGFRFARQPGGDLDQFFAESYRPGLLAEVCRGGRPVAEKPLGRNKAPLVKVSAPDGRLSATREAAVVAEVTDQGGGVSGLSVEVNGARVAAPAKAERGRRPTKTTFTVSLAPGPNKVRVKAANADGSWESAPAEVELTYLPTPEPRGRLYVVAVGVSAYAEPGLTLRHPAADARALAESLQRRGGKAFDRVDVIPLYDREATKAAVEDTIKDVAELTGPQDTLVVILCGHGALLADRLYFGPHDLKVGPDRPDEALRTRGLALTDVATAMGTAPAQKRALIVDAADVGGAPGKLSEFALRGAVERLSRSQGMHVVAGTGGPDDARLCPALMAAAPAASPEPVDVADWFTAAIEQAGPVIRKLGGSADVQGSTRAPGFTILGAER